MSTFRPAIREYVAQRVPRKVAILDVGAGSGAFGRLLGDWSIDALEAHSPYIGQFGLNGLYRNVFCSDVRHWDFNGDYGVVIFGDVLEHLTVKDAQRVLDRACASADDVIVQVPYLYKQGGGDVEWERHHQPDLTRGVFLERYPQMRLLMDNDRCGVFVKEMSGGGHA